MQLISNWSEVLKRAWSVKFLALLVIGSGVDAALPIFLVDGEISIKAMLTFFVSAGAMASRLVAQKGLSLPEEPEA